MKQTIPALIVDANSFSDGNLRKEVGALIAENKLRIVLDVDPDNERIYGALGTELKNANTRRFSEYFRTNKFFNVCNTCASRKTAHLENKNTLDSDDPHIVALAIISGANTLHTEDEDLISDFRNCKEIDKQSDCIKRKNHPDRRVIKPVSPIRPDSKRTPRIIENLLKTAKVQYSCCECMTKSGGCQVKGL